MGPIAPQSLLISHQCRRRRHHHHHHRRRHLLHSRTTQTPPFSVFRLLSQNAPGMEAIYVPIIYTELGHVSLVSVFLEVAF